MDTRKRPVYLDCNASSPIDPQVADIVIRFMTVDFGNAGSRTHVFGIEAARAVNQAREQVAAAVGTEPGNVVFTSGATESNNLALLGLAASGESSRRKHIVSTAIEHKAILEPLEFLKSRGFDVTLVAPNPGGWVSPGAVVSAVRPDTLLVSVMQVNNETGVIQPVREIADRLADQEVYLHTDASQGFGKELDSLRHPRVDLISISGHKIYAPKGVGALVLRKRGLRRPPLQALAFGGGQERGLRPGTMPVPLVVGLGLAAEIAVKDNLKRMATCRSFKDDLLAGLAPLSPVVHGDQARTLPNVVNLSFPGIDSEAAIVALKDTVAISNGSACTSSSYEPSHVLLAMGLPREEVQCSLRWSWCHMTEAPNWDRVVAAIRQLH